MPAAKSANLCWGQHHHVLRYLQVPAPSRHEAHISTSYPLPPGCATEHVRAALNHLVRRHEVLRTVYDLDARPWPRQRVQPPAPLVVPEVSTEDDGTATPADVLARLNRTPFDLGREWPIRACAITTGGRLRRLHLVFNHLSFDDVSLDQFSAEFDALLAARIAGRPATLPPVRHQPVDLARYEAARSEAEVDAALAHWRTEVRRLPADLYARRRLPRTEPPAAHSASLTVPTLLATARAVAARQHVWPSAAHLAAYAVTLAGYTGERLIAHRMYTSQRDASGHPSVLTCMSYPTLVCVDLADDPPFSEVLRRAAARVEQSMAHAHVPYDRIVGLVAEEGARRGQPVRVVSELNFLDNAPRRCRANRDRLTWNAAPLDWAKAGSDVYFRIYEWADGITLAMQAMAEVFDRDAVAGFLRGYARLLLAHRDPGVDLRVSQAVELMDFAPAPVRSLLRLGPDLVDLAGTAAALREHDAVLSVELTHTERGLVADVLTSRPIDPAQLRTHALDAVHDHPAARCPDWFRITSTQHGTAQHGIAQHAGPVREGSGHATPVPPADPAEQAITTAVAMVNGLREVRVEDSYPRAGGAVLRLPRVVTALRELGWDGVPIDQFTTARPLRGLAGRLRRVSG